jgi:predicted ATPase
MLLLRSVSKTGNPDLEFPFTLPVIKNLTALDFAPVTLFVGENGSGKSTLLEGIAAASRLPIAGGGGGGDVTALPEAQKLAKFLRLSWGLNNHTGFFLRAEDFFGFIKYLNHLQSELRQEKAEFEEKLTGYGRQLAAGSLENQIRNLRDRYGDLEALSHGEGYLKFFASRLVPKGLFLLDEPEAALSPTRQLGLISLILESLQSGSQFIIATHSPILMSIPEAEIFWFGEQGIVKKPYSQIDHVTITRDFLAHPQSFLHHLNKIS